MYCPECGNDAGEAKFCPECGANLAGVKDALSGKPAPAAATRGPEGATTRPTTSPPPLRPAAPAGSRRPSSGAASALSPWSSSSSSSWPPAASAAARAAALRRAPAPRRSKPSAADTSGSYSELVARANDLYDQGDPAFQNQQFEQGGAYFAAAAKVYAAAWKKQATDPSVGTDYAVTLFYSGDIAGALKQIDAVLQANPDWQKGWLNKGVFLSHEARIAKQQGDTKTADKYNAQAKQALTKAVAIDPKSDAGKQADTALQQLQ